jgi:hypothetical protein
LNSIKILDLTFLTVLHGTDYLPRLKNHNTIKTLKNYIQMRRLKIMDQSETIVKFDKNSIKLNVKLLKRIVDSQVNNDFKSKKKFEKEDAIPLTNENEEIIQKRREKKKLSAIDFLTFLKSLFGIKLNIEFNSFENSKLNENNDKKVKMKVKLNNKIIFESSSNSRKHAALNYLDLLLNGNEWKELYNEVKKKKKSKLIENEDDFKKILHFAYNERKKSINESPEKEVLKEKVSSKERVEEYISMIHWILHYFNGNCLNFS